MKTKHKIGATLLKLFCLGIGTFLGIFCLLFWFFIVKNFNAISLVGTLSLSVISICAISVGGGLLRTIRIDETTKIVSVTYWGVFKKEWTRNEITGYNADSYATRYGDFERTVLGTTGGNQIYVFSFDTKNYSELKNLIASIYYIDGRLKFNQLWPIIIKTSIVFFGLLILAAIISLLTS